MAETLGDRLKRTRSSRGLGLRGAAGLIGVSPTYLSRVENNLEAPTEEKIQKLAEVLGDNFDELMQLAGKVPADVAEVIKADSGMPAFLRRAREENLSAEQLSKILDERTKEK
jgi:HTH-type transcriptional regulator, competence development regulator